MKNIIYVFLTPLFLVCPNFLSAQDLNVSQLEKSVKFCIAKTYAACVRVWGYDTVSKKQNSAQFSAVVVNKEGIMLTVCHAIQHRKTYKVRFPDGREAIAVALGSIGNPQQSLTPDLGVMKLVTKGDWPIAEMGWSHTLKVGEPCVSIAYPESLNQLKPTVRLGQITNTLNRWGFVQSSCKMEPGDSGGPLFDLEGRVIALHSRCMLHEDENYEVAIDLYRKYWTALQLPITYEKPPGQTDSIPSDNSGKISTTSGLSNKEIDIINLKTKHAVVRLHNPLKDNDNSALATVINSNGKTYLVSKSSMVGSNFIAIINDKKVKLNIVSRDEDLDLVLMTVSGKMKSGISIDQLNNIGELSKDDLGSVMVSLLPEGSRLGVLSSMLLDLPTKPSQGYFGAFSIFKDGKASVTRVIPQSPAAKSGLNVGDDVLKINGVAITSADVYNLEMSKLKPGDMVKFEGNRNGEAYTLDISFISPPTGTHPADNFAGGKSIRRDGFKNLFLHDAIVKADECGGPVFRVDGRFYGLNIARFSRTSVAVIPAGMLYKFLTKSIAGQLGNSGKSNQSFDK